MLSRNKAAQCRKSPWVRKTKAAATIQYFCSGSHVGALTAAVEADSHVALISEDVHSWPCKTGEYVMQPRTYRCADDVTAGGLSGSEHSRQSRRPRHNFWATSLWFLILLADFGSFFFRCKDRLSSPVCRMLMLWVCMLSRPLVDLLNAVTQCGELNHSHPSWLARIVI